MTLSGTVGLVNGAGITIPLLNSATNTSSVIGSAAGTLTISGAVGGGAVDLTKIGAGVLTLLNTNTYTGKTTVLGGTLNLSGNNNAAVGAVIISGAAVPGFTAGTLSINLFGTLGVGANGITIDQGGTLSLDNSAVNQTRLTNATKPNLVMNSGTLTFLAFNVINAASSESVGTIALSSGLSIINAGYQAAQAANATSLLNIGGLTPPGGSDSQHQCQHHGRHHVSAAQPRRRSSQSDLNPDGQLPDGRTLSRHE